MPTRLLVKAGSGALTLGVPDSPGVPAAIAAAHHRRCPTTTSPRSSAASPEQGDEIACVIVEPVAGNMGCVPPAPGFLEALRALLHAARRAAHLRRSDDRLPRRAAAARRRCTASRPISRRSGKIIGGGLPVGAFGGRRDIMERLAPLGPVYQAGTLSGNPVAMAAGLATLEGVARPGFHARLAQATGRLVDGFEGAAREAGIPLAANRVCGMFSLFFTGDGPVTDYRRVMASDAARFRLFFHGMLDAGVYLAPSPFEAGFVSAAHGAAEIDATIEAARRVFAALARKP